MHYSNLLLIERPEEITEESIKEAVSAVMGSKSEWWDWYQIGGRFSGLLDGYDPEKDPKNTVVCSLCSGTGKRADMTVVNGCNGCLGTGKHVAWPTNWGFHAGDVCDIQSVTNEQYGGFYRVVCDFGVFASEKYLPWSEAIEDKLQKVEMPPLEWLKQKHPNYLAVVVDSHK